MVILGLGSNLGDRMAYLTHAVGLISSSILSCVRLSPVYEGGALLKPGSPKEWDSPFLNMAVIGETHLSPRQLLTAVKSIEKRVGRRPSDIWAPREIDIDILAYDSQVINETDLQIPHVELLKRSFALMPLKDLAPNWRFPVAGPFYGKTAYELIQKVAFDPQEIERTELRVERRIPADAV